MQDLPLQDMPLYKKTARGEWVRRHPDAIQKDLDRDVALAQAHSARLDAAAREWEKKEAEKQQERDRQRALWEAPWMQRPRAAGTMEENEAGRREFETFWNRWSIASDNKILREKTAEEAAELAARRKEMQERFRKEFEKRQKEQEAQKKRLDSLRAIFDAREKNLASPKRSAYDGDKPQGYGGGGEEGGVGATLLTHRGITGGQKLGGKSKFGGKTLLGV